MIKEEYEKLSIFLIGINSQFNEGALFVKDKGSDEELNSYRKNIGQAMGRVVDMLETIYELHPDLRPKQVGGSYLVPDSAFESKFYSAKDA